MTTKIFSWFGLNIPEGVETIVEWGGRAIFTRDNPTDIPYDRHQFNMEKGTDKERSELGKWLIKSGMPAVKKWVQAKGITSSDSDVFVFEKDGFTLRATPNRSFGYMYLCAYKEKLMPVDKNGEKFYITPDGSEEWSGRDGIPVPAIGDSIKFQINVPAEGVVLGYFIADVWLGLIVRLTSKVPDWKVKQDKGTWMEGLSLVFGVDLTEASTPPKEVIA